LSLIPLKIFTHTVPVSFGKAAKTAKLFLFLGALCGFAREKTQKVAGDSYSELML
jgi:hypothetical protein